MHTFTGQRWITLKGWKRNLLRAIDKFIILTSTHVLADSHTQADFLNKEFRTDKVKCLGDGSFGGIDVGKFDCDKFDRVIERSKLNIEENDFVILYLGRITKDKGIEELLQAYSILNKKNIKLLLVGPYEKKLDALSEEYEHLTNNLPGIIRF